MTFLHNDFKWTFQVPYDLKAGEYVLRHEILALHGGWDTNGAQVYPQCINLGVTGRGNTEIKGGWEVADDVLKRGGSGYSYQCL